MNLLRVPLFLFSLFVALAGCGNDHWIIYNPKADPRADLQAAVQKAAAENKKVLAVFGADWCPDCRNFHQKMNEPPLSQTLNDNFVIMHVDVGEFDHNIEFAKQWGNPIKGGIPAFAIVNADNQLMYVNDVGEFTKARRLPNEQLSQWFEGILQKL